MGGQTSQSQQQRYAVDPPPTTYVRRVLTAACQPNYKLYASIAEPNRDFQQLEVLSAPTPAHTAALAAIDTFRWIAIGGASNPPAEATPRGWRFLLHHPYIHQRFRLAMATMEVTVPAADDPPLDLAPVLRQCAPAHLALHAAADDHLSVLSHFRGAYLTLRATPNVGVAEAVRTVVESRVLRHIDLGAALCSLRPCARAGRAADARPPAPVTMGRSGVMS